jgi:hypothetical protein
MAASAIRLKIAWARERVDVHASQVLYARDLKSIPEQTGVQQASETLMSMAARVMPAKGGSRSQTLLTKVELRPR